MTHREAGAELYVQVAAPNGELGYLPIMPAIRPDSALRFAKGRPLPASTFHGRLTPSGPAPCGSPCAARGEQSPGMSRD